MDKFWNAWDGFVMNLALTVVILAGVALIALCIAVAVSVIKRQIDIARVKRLERRRLMPWKYDEHGNRIHNDRRPPKP